MVRRRHRIDWGLQQMPTKTESCFVVLVSFYLMIGEICLDIVLLRDD